ncbi:MAG: hypothetical protein LH616_19070, partial [Ilumatobacteraceae bacterium]|nr:hypothetical protein [Ilumatobacteraceae bacterium]
SYTCRGAFAGLGSWQRYASHLAIDGIVRFTGACLLGLGFYLIAIVVEAVATPGGRNRNREGS